MMRGPLIRNNPSTRILRISSSLKSESLYGVWTTHGIVHNFEFGKQSPLNSDLLNRPIFGRLTDPKRHLPLIATVLGMSEVQVRKLKGLDITGERPDLSVFRKSLRFCQKCLDLGYHSILYQHIGIARCPLHEIQFYEVCPECKKVIVPTFASTIKHPFECPHCLLSLARTIHRPDDHQFAVLADHMAEGRRATLASSSAACWHRLYVDYQPNTVRTHISTAVSRHYQRVTVWAEKGDTFWTRFPEEHMSINYGAKFTQENTSNSLDLGLAAERVIIWLMDRCRVHEKIALRIAQRFGRFPRGLQFNVHASLIGTALYKLLYAYDLAQEALIISSDSRRNMHSKANACHRKNLPRYGPDAPEIPILNFRLMQLEMYGMFAKILMSLKSHRAMSEVNWMELPHALEFAPTWLLTKTLNGASVRIRSRANEETLDRLIKRLWLEQLVYESKNFIDYGDFWKNNLNDTVWPEKIDSDLRTFNCNKQFVLQRPSLSQIELLKMRYRA